MKKYIVLLLISLVVILNIPGLQFSSKELLAAYSTVITVDSNGDVINPGGGCGVPCTLRGAISYANTLTGSILVNFQSSMNITVGTALPPVLAVDNRLVIDGEENDVVIDAGSTSIDQGLVLGSQFDPITLTYIIVDNVIKNVTLTNFRNGIVVYGNNNTIQNVTVAGPQTTGVCTDEGERGIMVLGRDTEHTIGNTLINNTINCYRKGIMLQSVMGASVTGNIITQNISEADLSGSPTFNDANPCVTAGIEIQGYYNLGTATARKNFITNNEITGNGFSNPGGGCAADFRSAGIMLSLYGSSPITLDTAAQLNRISGNEITDNVGDGIYVRQGINNEILNNHIARNGTVPSLGDATDDTGNGIALVCDLGGIVAPVSGNLIYRNTIERNADNGIFIGKFCEVTGLPVAQSSAYNPLIENVIFENGRVSGTSVPADDDGIGIDLQDQSDLTAFAFTSGNTNISENGLSLSDGGNQMIDTPVITTAAYNSVSSSWTVEGTTFVPSGAVGALVELYQVGCASGDLPTDLNTCDVDTYSGDQHALGHGQGRIFLGRTYVTASAWSITVPSTVGFGGGLLTATNTAVDTDGDCVLPPTSGLQSLVGPGNRFCSSSEFSGNFLAEVVTPPLYSGLLTKVIAPQVIMRTSTGTTILNFANTGDAAFSSVLITDNLSIPGVSYVSGSCRWAIDSMPSGASNCSFSGDEILLSGFASLAPGHVLSITFEFVVPLSATIGAHTNGATAVVTPAAAIAGTTANFEVIDLTAPTYSGVLNKVVSPGVITQSGTGTTLISFTNTGDADFTSIIFTDDLDLPGVDYIPSTCRWAVNALPIYPSNCIFGGDNIALLGFSTLAPSDTVYVLFDFAVPADAPITSHTNSVSVALTPSATIPDVDVNFAVVSAPPATCGTTGANPNATFVANGQAVGAVIEQYPGSLVLENSQPSQGDAPVAFNWVVDGVSSGTSSDITLNLSVGTHAVTHIVSDCDGSFDVRTLTVIIKAIPPSPVPAMTLRKSISPNTDVHIGDLITNVIQIDNPQTSSGFTMIDLSDELDGLSNLVPVCNYSIGSFPTASSDTCTVSTDGQIVLDLSADPFTAGTSLFIRYIAAVTGAPATYNNAVSYNASTSTVTPAPTDANASFTVEAVSGGPSCPAVATVDASFTLNNNATPTQVVVGSPGVMSLVNSSTTGDAPVDYHWYVNGVLQSESAGTLSRSITDTTTFTLLKVDCDGSAAMDTLTVLIGDTPPSPQPTVSPSPTASPTPTTSPTPSASPSPSVSPTPSASPSVTTTPTPSATPTITPTTNFSVEKVIMNPLDLYSTDSSARTIKFKSTIHNLGSVTSSYNFTDTISTAFLPNAVVNDLAGGLNESIPGLIRVTNISIPALSSKAVIYTLTIKSDTDFPLSTFRLDTNASPDDSDFYPVRIKSARLANNSNDDPDNALDAPDGLLVNLGEKGTITLDLGVNKLLVDGDGDDFAVALGQGKISVAVSQDGRSFERLKGTRTFDLADADLIWARYIKITDSSVNAQSTATVDAVCLLNLGVGVTDTSQVALASDVRTNALTAYIDVTAAFDEPLTGSDCRTSASTTTKQARTIELVPPAPVILPVSPIPTPVVTPTPVPVELPKTGPEGIVLAMAGTVFGAYLLRYFLIRRRQVVRITSVEANRK